MHKNNTNRNEEIMGMKITINLIDSHMDITDYMTTEEIMLATIDNKHLSMLSGYILQGLPSMRAKVQKDIQPYRSFTEEIVIICGIAMQCERIMIPASLQRKCLNHLYINYMHIEKTRLLVC